MKDIVSLEESLRLLDNLFGYLKVSKQLKKCEIVKNKSKYFKKEPENLESMQSEALIVRKVIKIEDQYLCLDVTLIVNLNDFDEFRSTFIQSYKKFCDMKQITSTPFETQEYLLLLMLISGEKIFGFKIDINNYHKTRFNFLKNNKSSVNANIFKNKKWSLIEMAN